MSSPFAHRNLPMLLLQARETVMQRFRPHLKRHGLTEQQWRVLRALDDVEEVEIGRIARLTSILGPSLTGVLERMERGGLVVRSRSGSDQRRVTVRLTPRSRQLIETLGVEVEAQYARIERALGREPLQALYALLDAVIALPVPDEAPADRRPRSPARTSRKTVPRDR